MSLSAFLAWYIHTENKYKRYSKNFSHIRKLIDTAEVTSENFLLISDKFSVLYKNNVVPKQTEWLKVYFLKKYQLYHPNTYGYEI